MMNAATAKHKAVFIVGALLLIFIGPMLAAWSLYTSKAPVLQTINYGELLDPSLQLSNLKLTDTNQAAFPATVLQGRWLLFYISPVTCDTLCTENLYKMRQVRLATGKDQERVQRLLITYPERANPRLDSLLAQQYAGTFHAVMTPAQLTTFFPHSLVTDINKQQGGLFLADPVGNIILYYAPDADPEKLLKDLTRLLRVSQIG